MTDADTRDTPPRRLLIGVGNRYRGDDAAGVLVARRVREAAPAGVEVLEEEGELSDLLDAWKEVGQVVLVDAVYSGAAPGTIHRFEAEAGPLPAQLFRFSTHAFSVAEAIELARALGQLPPRLTVYGIEGSEFTAGAPLTPAVEAALGELVARALEELSAPGDEDA
jgi:hydrogenase maturation protease